MSLLYTCLGMPAERAIMTTSTDQHLVRHTQQGHSHERPSKPAGGMPDAAINGREVPRGGVMRAQVEVAVQAAAADVHRQLDQPLHQRRVDVASDDVQLGPAGSSAVTSFMVPQLP